MQAPGEGVPAEDTGRHLGAGPQPAAPPEVIELAPGRRVALLARVHHPAEVGQAVRRLGLVPPRPTLVLVGGASGLPADQQEELGLLFTQAIVPIVRGVDGVVVDGGTDAGVMRLMGEAEGAGDDFPLVGVAAEGTITMPGTSGASDTAHLEANHSHFVLVPGDHWGDESEWIALVATAIAGSQPSATVLVNGGETAWRDVEASVAARRPVVVVDGSGRTADDIAAALRGARHDERGYRLAASGLVEAVSLDAGAGELAEAVWALLGG